MKKLVLFFLLIFCLNAFANLGYFNFEKNNYKDSQGFTYQPNQNGTISVYKENRLIGDLEIIIAQQSIIGDQDIQENPRTRVFIDFNGEVNPIKRNLSVIKEDRFFLAQLDINFFDDSNPAKRMTAPRGTKINAVVKAKSTGILSYPNSKVYFVLTLPNQKTINFRETLTSNETRYYQTIRNEENTIRIIEDNFAFDFRDILRTHEIDRVSVSSTPNRQNNEQTIGIAINTGTIMQGQTITLDPQILNTDYNFATSVSGDWNNMTNIFADDGSRATANVNDVNMMFGGFGFDFVPHDAAIIGIDLRLEIRTPGCTPSGTGGVNVFVSKNGGNTFKDLNAGIQNNPQGSSCGGETIRNWGGDRDTYRMWWEAEELKDANMTFKVQSVLVGAATEVQIDYAAAKIWWITPPVNNIIADYSFNSEYFHLAAIETGDINESNLGICFSFDIELDANSGTVEPDLCRYEGEGSFNGNIGLPTWNLSGYIGGARDFNVNNKDYMTIDYRDSHNLEYNFSTNLWIKTTRSSNTLIDKGVSITSADFRLTTNNTGIPTINRAENTLGSTITAIDTCTAINDIDDNSWHMVTVTYDNPEKKVYGDANFNLYVDANHEKTCAFTGRIKNTGSFWVGCTNHVGTPFNCANGLMDEIKIYDKTLTQNEINNLYTNNITQFRTSGTLDFNSLTTSDTNINRLDINALIGKPLDSNVEISIGNYNPTLGNYLFGPYRGFDSDNNASNLGVETPLNYSTRWLLTTDENNFTTPIIDMNFTVNPYYSCAYKGYGDYNVSCNLCNSQVITGTTNLDGNNLIVNNSAGGGTIDFNTVFSNTKEIFVASYCNAGFLNFNN